MIAAKPIGKNSEKRVDADPKTSYFGDHNDHYGDYYGDTASCGVCIDDELFP
jgi:hypothetical protein